MKARIWVPGVVVVAIIVALAIPVVLKDRGYIPLKGPKLGDVAYQNVEFPNDAANLTLGGMLFLPAGVGPFPTAVIIHGSGPSRRDSTWYLSVTEHLRKSGIAVLLPDKRGCEKSEGDWVGADFDDLAGDTVAAVDFVRRSDAVDSSSIGIIGMSQGGWIAPAAAARDDNLAFIVSMSGAVVTTGEQVEFEEFHNIGSYTYRFIARAFAPLTSRRLMKMDYLAPLAGFDPLPYWRRIDIPVFFAFGGDDRYVPVETSIQRLEENGLDHHLVKVYPEGGHGIQDPGTGMVNGTFLEDLAEFILRADELTFDRSENTR